VALEGTIRAKDEFIVYLQDEVAELKALMRDEKFERVKNEVEFKGARGYRSVYSKIREQALANKVKHTALEIETE